MDEYDRYLTGNERHGDGLNGVNGGDLDWMDLAEEAGQLREAMATRAPIEQAKGILIGSRGYGPDAAWAELRRASSEENVKLRDLAGALVSLSSGHPNQAVDGTPLSPAAVAAARRRWCAVVRAARIRLAEPAAMD